MFTFLVIVALVASVILGFAILIQNPKGGGLSGTFGGAANQIFGYKRSTDDIERITWGIVIVIFVLSLSTAAFKPSQSTETINNRYTPESQAPAGMGTSPEQESAPIEDNSTQQPAQDGSATELPGTN